MITFALFTLAAVLAGLYLYRNRQRWKGIRSNIAAIGGTIVAIVSQILPQLEMFPWREYLDGNTALAASIGTLVLVAVFSALKRTVH